MRATAIELSNGENTGWTQRKDATELLEITYPTAAGLLPVRRDQEYLKQVLNYLLKTPDGTSEPPSLPVVLDPNWETAPRANLLQPDQPAGWTERGKPVLIVLPIAPQSPNETLGPWLVEHVSQNRNMVRFLLPTAESANLYADRNLLISARCEGRAVC